MDRNFSIRGAETLLHSFLSLTAAVPPPLGVQSWVDGCWIANDVLAAMF